MTRVALAFFVSLVASAVMSEAAQVPCPNPARSRAVVEAFKRAHPCPATCATYVREGRRFVLYEKCGACQVDHICPLACCGADAVKNLQWMRAEDNRAKGADCAACTLPRQEP